MKKRLIFKSNRKHFASGSDFTEFWSRGFRHEGEFLRDGIFCRKAHIFISISRNTHPGLDHHLANREKRLPAFQIDFSAVEKDVSVPRTDVSIVEEDVSVPRTDVSVVEEDVLVPRTDVSIVEEDVPVPRTDVSVVGQDVLIDRGDVPAAGAIVLLVQLNQNIRGKIARPWRYYSR